MAAAPKPADSVRRSFVDRAPAGLQPWLRLARFDRPIGFWLLFWPCAFGLTLGVVVVAGLLLSKAVF